uniref:Uncharacterized protein n=1 Tax=Lepeophtheirus salmonis TaxID=72036 RepID=A0A0K2V6F3_LEPSM
MLKRAKFAYFNLLVIETSEEIIFSIFVIKSFNNSNYLLHLSSEDAKFVFELS